MAFSKARRLSDFIAADGTIPTGKFASATITSDHIANLGITHADLHTNMDLTGKTVLVANASTGDSDTTAANTAFVQQEIAALVDSSPSALNTLNELAAALGDDANFSTTVTNSIATKLPLAGGTMTGDTRLNDSVKHKYGSGDYFQAYHDGSNAYLKNTAGWLNMPMGGSGVSIANSDFSKILAKFIVNGAAELYHNGAKKLETTSDGVVVSSTGWATAVFNGPTGGDIILQDSNVNIGEVYAGVGHGMVIKAHSGQSITFLTNGAATEKARILTTGEMGIGSGGPTADYGLSISKGGALGLRIKSDGQQGYTQGAISLESSVNTDSPAGRGQGVYMFNEANDITWYTGTLYNNASTYGISYKSGSSLQHAAADNANAGLFMVIKNNGNVGIGTNNPTIGKLHVAGKIYSTTEIQGDNAVAKTSNSLATFGSNSSGVGIALARDADAATYPDLVIGTTGAVNVGEQGNVIGSKWLGSHENLYWNSKFMYSGGGYGSAPDKWITQGGNVTITSEHPHNKGFSTQYTNVQSASHTTNINNATPSTPHWKGVYITFSGATNYGGNQNSSIGGGWENGEGAIMKCVYNGSGASGSTNAIRGYMWKNFFSADKVQTRQSFFYFLESGEFSSGYFAGYGGQYGSDYVHGSANADSATGQHRHTTTGQWVYVNHQCGSYLGATYNNSSQNYMHGFGFRPGYATTVWIAVPGLTAQVRDDGKTINIHSAQQQIGQG